MKQEKLALRKPVKVLQVYRNKYYYGKDEKSYSARVDTAAWRPIQSLSGFVQDGVLYLPESIRRSPDFSNCDLLLLDDDMNFDPDSRYEPALNHCFSLQHRRKVHVFEIGYSNGELELFLN